MASHSSVGKIRTDLWSGRWHCRDPQCRISDIYLFAVTVGFARETLLVQREGKSTICPKMGGACAFVIVATRAHVGSLTNIVPPQDA